MPPLLPIFPLELVLLPGVPLPLHIFEPRYKEMIGECLAAKKHFGVVRAAKEEGIAEIGCTAEIIKLVRRYDNGRLDIATVGRRRFEITEVNHERSFLQAEFLYLDDEVEQDASAEQRLRALELFAELQSAVASEGAVDRQAPLLSFQLAGALPIDLDFKQTMLSIRSEEERLRSIIEFFEAVVPQVKKAARRREKAGGNGHVP